MYWTWNKKVKRWEMRKKGIKVGRLYFAHPSSGERYDLRMLLHIVRGAMNYRQLQTIDGKECPTFKQACIVLGLVGDDNEWDEAIEEASIWATGNNLRNLFAEILLYCGVSNPHALWEKHWVSLADDIQARFQKEGGLPNYQLSDDDLKNEALIRIETILNKNGKSLNDFSDMPMPGNERIRLPNRLLREELEYETTEIDGEFQKLYAGLNAEQLYIFNQILYSCDNKIGGVYFVNGSGGTGKTYLWRTLCYGLRNKQKIVLTVASSGIAALLLPGGRTAHSRFKIPMQLYDDSCCSISKRSDLAGLIKETSLIIWDEAPMTNKYAYDALDRTCRDILSAIDQNANDKVFGGITVALGGDFRQILPVVPKGQREQIVDASLIRSNIWRYCKVFNLTRNMRLDNPSTYENIEELRQFANWILGIGNGSTESISLYDGDESNWVRIPDESLINNENNKIENLAFTIYDNLSIKYVDPNYLQERIILTLTNDTVHSINEMLLAKLPGKLRTYLSADDVEDGDDYESNNRIFHTTEYLNSLKFNGLPDHKLNLKKGAPVMLMRNLNQFNGLCNGTRLVIKEMGDKVLKAETLTGSNIGDTVLIPRIVLSPSDTEWPFTLRRRQFPLTLAFALTINKSQGQTLEKVGLYLPKPVFTHGQLYVALSRTTSKNGLKILLDKNTHKKHNYTRNVVYTEVLCEANMQSELL